MISLTSMFILLICLSIESNPIIGLLSTRIGLEKM
jgi:hypothetical protein